MSEKYCARSFCVSKRKTRMPILKPLKMQIPSMKLTWLSPRTGVVQLLKMWVIVVMRNPDFLGEILLSYYRSSRDPSRSMCVDIKIIRVEESYCDTSLLCRSDEKCLRVTFSKRALTLRSWRGRRGYVNGIVSVKNEYPLNVKSTKGSPRFKLGTLYLNRF